eukprot:gene16014-7350_t
MPQPHGPSTSTLFVDAKNAVLLQTAKGYISPATNSQQTAAARLIFDSGSQRSYISARLRDSLALPTVGRETLTIKTFGEEEGEIKVCDVTQFCVRSPYNDTIVYVTAYVVPVVCSPLQNQEINFATQAYPHLATLPLADFQISSCSSEIDILIGLDFYWSFVSGGCIRGEKGGPCALESTLGWILSGEIQNCKELRPVSTNLTQTHVLKVAERTLDDTVSDFWKLESLGIDQRRENSVYQQFEEEIQFKNGRYEVKLPWKPNHPLLPDNYVLCRKRLQGLSHKLKADSNLMKEYSSIMKLQEEMGIIERVKDDQEAPTVAEILVKFRLHRVALTSDIEKAFLMISIHNSDRDVLRFLWFTNIEETMEIQEYRFCRVVFGVSCSPFLLNATLRRHIESYAAEEPEICNKLINSLYADDINSGSHTIEEAFELYEKSKRLMQKGGFNLRKWRSNSSEVMNAIRQQESSDAVNCENTRMHREDDESFAKSTTGKLTTEEASDAKVLGVPWNSETDVLSFKLSHLAELTKENKVTKRAILRTIASLFDPLGLITPISTPLKVFLQQLFESKLEWDEQVPEHFQKDWIVMMSQLKRIGKASVAKLAEGSTWWRGPTWLANDHVSIPIAQELFETEEMPSDCSSELKASDPSKTTVLSTSAEITHNLPEIIHIERYSSYNKVLRITALPERYFEEDIDYNETADVARKREQHVARVFQHYWRRWKKEYLIDLREYHKVPNKTCDRPNINIGDVVTVQDENIRNRIEWKLGRVADLIIGRDDVTRGARIQLANGNFIERPIQKLFPLELSSEPKEACATNEKTTRSEDKQEKTKRKAAVIAQESIRIIDQLEEDNEL